MSTFSLLSFDVSVQHVEPGHAVHVVGDHPALGCWDVSKSVPLRPHGPSRWMSACPVSVFTGVPVQYKYVVCAEGHLQRWENILGNRIVVPALPEVFLRDRIDEQAVSHAPDFEALQPASETVMPPLPPPLPSAALGQPAAGGGEPARVDPDTDGAVLVVSYILPLIISKAIDGEWEVQWNQDSIIAKKQATSEAKRIVWVGCPGIHVDVDDHHSLTLALAEYSCVPVFLDSELDHAFYFGCCRSFLWPTFHNVIKARCFHDKVWRAYCTANRRFADKVIEVYDSGDLVWIHDYHLMLLPSYILRKLRNARVGFFLHIPFPSSEIFRTIPVRDELLRGMLNADLIGFHVFEYARHFLTCCKRLLGLESEFLPGSFYGAISVKDHKRDVLITCSHVGIEPDVCAAAQAVSGAEVAISDGVRSEICHSLRQRRADGYAILLGIDEVERLKGLPLKLLAFEQLLRTRSADLIGKVCLVQLGLKARNYTPAVQHDFDELLDEINEIISRIESSFPGAVQFIELPTISLAQRMQLWALADVALFTPLREGVNTFPLEAVYARRALPAGVVLLSEFSSTARVLNGALRVNPWNTEELSLALERCICMRSSERDARRDRDLRFVEHETTTAWAQRFVVDLRKTVRSADEPWTPIGFGLAGFRRVGWGSTFRALDTTEVLAAYRRARRRAIFVDWGGTLVGLEVGMSESLVDYYQADLPTPVHHCLEELAADPSNLLMVLSGRERPRVDAVFHRIQGASLCSEHGFHYKLGSFPGVRRVGTEQWQQLIEGFDLSWKEPTRAILEAYTTRTNGAIIQDKGSSLTWKYDDVDPEFGSMQVKELHQHLQGVLSNAPVECTMGKGYLEVRPQGIDKGVMVDHIINMLYANSGGVEFVLCIGDDSADEFMFSVLQERFGNLPPGGGPSVFTTVVGRKPSAANYFLNDPDEVLELLQSLRLHSTRANRNRSMGDLQHMHTAGRTRSPAAWNGGFAGGGYAAGFGGGGGVRRGGEGSVRDWSRAGQPSLYHTADGEL